MTLLYNRIKFTTIVDAALEKGDLKSALDQIQASRSEIITGLRDQTNKGKLMSLNTLYQEFDDVLSDMINGDATNIWKAECKFYAQKDGTIKCSCNGLEVVCGNHFPECEMLVTTKLTREARVVLIDCMVNKKVLSIVGPAGIGKTETCKDIISMLGFSYNLQICSQGPAPNEKCYEAMSKLSNVILDDFNLFESEVQEKVIQTLRDNNVFVMVTCNPGAPQRKEYTWTEKHAHTSMLFTVPDRVDIMKVMLSHEGLPNYSELATKIVALYKDLEANLSKQNHYDFGLRALLSACRGIRIQVSDGNIWDEAMFAASIFHTERFHESIVKEDREAAIKMVLSHLGPDRREYERPPIKQILGSCLQQKHAACILGNIDNETLQGVRDYTENTWGYKPFNVEWANEEVTFGKDGNDGTFVKVLREAIKEKKACIYFSGEGSGNFKDWAANLNTVNDDNRILCLKSGEKISTKNVSLCLCLPNADGLSPAINSRIGWIRTE